MCICVLWFDWNHCCGEKSFKFFQLKVKIEFVSDRFIRIVYQALGYKDYYNRKDKLLGKLKLNLTQTERFAPEE